ncbi:hypothetical protein XENOCAPTIV_019786, partial [Xenoophorus captivus]
NYLPRNGRKRAHCCLRVCLVGSIFYTFPSYLAITQIIYTADLNCVSNVPISQMKDKNGLPNFGCASDRTQIWWGISGVLRGITKGLFTSLSSKQLLKDCAMKNFSDMIERAPVESISLTIALLYMKLRCDDQPMLEHAEQLLGKLGGEMEAEDEHPDLDDDYEPCSDDEEGGETEAPMEH